MNLIFFYLVGVVTGVVIAVMTHNFSLSEANEPTNLFDNRRQNLWRIIIWILLWIALFGSGTPPME